MSFEKMDINLSFTNIALINSLERNRAIERMQQINAGVDWSRLDRILMRNFPIGINILAQKIDENPSITEICACTMISEQR